MKSTENTVLATGTGQISVFIMSIQENLHYFVFVVRFVIADANFSRFMAILTFCPFYVFNPNRDNVKSQKLIALSERLLICLSSPSGLRTTLPRLIFLNYIKKQKKFNTDELRFFSVCLLIKEAKQTK